MKFRKYQKLERFGRSGVRGIEDGECLIFHKLDGTNASVWYIEALDELRAGSRNRPLTFKKDNANFFKTIYDDKNIKGFLRDHPNYRLYGEFLVPHTLKTYEDNAWRKFYVFDVIEELGNGEIRYLHYDEYKPLLERYDIPYIPAISRIINGSYESFVKYLPEANFLVKDNQGSGEGIVIKNYNFKNQYGQTVWAKIVSNEFKASNSKTFGEPVVKNKYIEDKIVDKYCTESFIEKEYAKILNEKNGWKDQYIPMLLGIIWHEFLIEEVPQIVKDFRNPTIDFKILHSRLINKIKKVKKDIF